MISEVYKFKSENLWRMFQEQKITLQDYQTSLERLITSEVSTYDYDSQNHVRQNLWRYENERQSRNDLEQRQKQEDLRIQNLTIQEKYYEVDIPNIIEEYRSESKRYRNIHNQFQWMVMIGSVIVTSTTGATVLAEASQLAYWFKWISVLCSILVSISAAATGYFKFRERSANLQETADDLEHEYKSVGLEIGLYRGKEKKDALSMFAQTVEVRIMEQKKREQQLEQTSEANQIQAKAQLQG